MWLDTNRTSVFDYYQFWRNCEDSQLEKLMFTFTNLPVDEVIRLASATESAELNRAKEILAYEATCLAHGAEEAAKAFLTAGTKFGFADPSGKIATSSGVAKLDINSAAAAALPTVTLPSGDFEGDGMWVVKLLVDAGMSKSNGDARRLIQGGGAYINDERIAAADATVKLTDFVDGGIVVKAGKKNMKRIVVG